MSFPRKGSAGNSGIPSPNQTEKLRSLYRWGAVLILETGLRAGEALALEWGDIDEEKRTLKVTKNMVRVDGTNIIQKTARGVEVKIISKLLGHASVETTYNRYIHFFEGEIDDTLRQAVGV